MRIVIDLQGAQSESRLRGIGRYSLALAQTMVKNHPEHEFIVVLNGMFPETIDSIRLAFDGILAQENIRVWKAVAPVHSFDGKNDDRRHVAELMREAYLASLEPDMVHVTSLIEGFSDDAVHSIGAFTSSIPTAVTFYDLIPLLQPDMYLTPNPLFEKVYLEKVENLQRADLFLAISGSSRQEAIDYLQVGQEYAVNISAAADDHFKVLRMTEADKEQLRARFKLDRPFLMYSGATDDRKNHLRLFQAFALIPEDIRKHYQLAIVGGIPDGIRTQFEQHIRACGLDLADVIITGRVTDYEMTALYNLCHLFVFPSWHEGFGLPALEAMSCGAPVIGANTTSIPEVIARPYAFFDPFDTIAISKKIQEVLGNEKLRKSLARHGLKQAKRFSWSISAKLAIQAMEDWHRKHGAEKVVLARDLIVPQLMDRLATDDIALEPEDLLAMIHCVAQNHPKIHVKKMFVDISELAQRDSRTGVQRVVRSILKELLTNPPEGYQVEPIYASPFERTRYRYARIFTTKFLGLPEDPSMIDDFIEAKSGDIFLGLDLVHYTVKQQNDFYSDFRRLGGKVYFVVYDLLPILLPEVFIPEVPPLHQEWLTYLSHSDGLICISRAVADELHAWLHIFGPKRLHPLKIGWFHLGADVSQSNPSQGLPDNAQSVLQELTVRPTFLIVGTIEPRKSITQVLLAFERLWMQGVEINLVLVGKQGWNVSSLSKMLDGMSVRNHLFWLKSASDEYLELIYQHASCLIAASTGEGFGLPLIEAAQHKLPIIARDIPIFREVAGEHALYFSGHTPDAIADCIRHWLALKKPPTSDQMPWLTWHQSTDQLKQVIFNQQWYRYWIADDSIRLTGADNRLSTLVGQRVANEMRTTGRTGYLIYGPYISMPAGSYKVVIWGGYNGLGGAAVDIAIERSKEILVKSDITAIPNEKSLVTLEFTLTKACSDFEVRVFVDAKAEMFISQIEIIPQ